ncbi:unnamed protein product [Rotaria sp. Silwood2]|nr:unnamed protein product [Rotaria sp. Silwood2]CAF4049094.1 unnamed protein product [Rotaria sp. Silwood2]
MDTAITTTANTIAGMTLSSSVSESLYNQTLNILRSSENTLCHIVEQLNSESLQSSSTLDDLTQYRNFFRHEIKSVEKLELRMAIVGTMKAGKSTILNAIMGYDLLPSRNTAMTTLPTEILFSQHTKEPQLILKSELITMIHEIGRQLQLKDNQYNLEIRLRNEEDLIKMVKNISTGDLMILATETYENSKIVDSLKYINDVVRISIMLNIENSINYTWIPRLKVPLPHAFSCPQGEFIIIDTPGPNDSNLSAHLRQIVISELRKATLILVALEFIGSNSNDEAKLKEDIETIREYRNTDSTAYLYALVNKVDQRIEGKHNSIEQTKAAVAMKYKIPLTNVHEISAMNAILSYTFRQEYEELGKKSDVTHETLMSKTKSYKMFMQQALGQAWEQAAEYINVTLLPNIAEKLWKKSNYDSFLHNALGIVSQHVVPICLTMALLKCNYYIEKCYEKINIRKSCLDIGEKTLFETVNRLKKEQQQLDSSRTEAEKDLRQWQSNVVEYIKSPFDEARSKSMQSVAEILDDKSTRHNHCHWKKLLHGKDILYFSAKEEADLFFETFFHSIKDISEDLMHALSRDINSQITRRCLAFRKQLQSITNDICESIGMRLKLLLGFEIIPLESSSNPLNVAYLSRALIQTEVPICRRLWYFLWLVKGTYKLKVNQLSKKQLEHVAIDALQDNLKEVEQYAADEAKERVETVFSSHFDSIDRYLLEQSNNIRAAIDDKKVERNVIERQFDLILNELNENKEKIQNTLQAVNTYFRQ